MEQTFIMISGAGVQGGLVFETIRRFENMHFSLKDWKTMNVDRRFAEKQYADLFAALFFRESADYITSGLVFAMVWEGENVVLTGQNIIGATNSSESARGTIRGDFIGRNFIHGSDSVERARKEIALWFPNLESGLPNLIPE